MTPQDPGERFEDWREARRRRWESRRQRRTARRSFGGISAGHGPGFRLVAGAFVLLIGILFLLENLGVLSVIRLWDFWPVILIAAGIARLIEGRSARSRTGGAVVTAVGLIFLVNSLGLLPWNVWSLIWPTLLILAGVLLLVRGFDARLEFRGAFHHDVGITSDNVLNEYAIFGGVNRRVDSQDFQGGEAIAVFGGIEIDMHRASTTRAEVDVEANAVFGGVEIWAPDNWDVVVQGAGILGGFEDKTHRAPDDGVPRPRLIIRGSAVFGGVVVKN